MRKVFLFNMVTLDGFFEGLNREFDWHRVDKEFNDFAEQQLNEVDLLLFGRVTYELMANYLPTEHAVTNDPIIASKMNSMLKIVFSRTLIKAAWNNTRLVKENIAQEVSRHKNLIGKNIAIFGSSTLAATLMQVDLIDEFRIMINPIILGKGNPLFKGRNDRFNVKLLKTKMFNSGNILLYYRPERKE